MEVSCIFFKVEIKIYIYLVLYVYELKMVLKFFFYVIVRMLKGILYFNIDNTNLNFSVYKCIFENIVIFI